MEPLDPAAMRLQEEANEKKRDRRQSRILEMSILATGKYLLE